LNDRQLAWARPAYSRAPGDVPLLAHRVISLRCGIWSLSKHSGHWSARTNQARFM